MLGKWEYIHYDSRTFTLGDIDSAHIRELIDFLFHIDYIDKYNASKNKEWVIEPIKLIINSFGGETYEAFGAIGAIDYINTPVHTIGLGSVMSAGLPIFMAGKVRIAHRLCSFMYHDISSSFEGKMEDQKLDLAEGVRLMKLFDKQLTSTSKLTKKMLEQARAKKLDWYFSGQEAYRLKIAHRLIP